MLVAFFHFWLSSSFPFLAEDPLVRLIEPLLSAFLVKLWVPLGVGFFFICTLVTWNWFRSPSVKKTWTTLLLEDLYSVLDNSCVNTVPAGAGVN